MYHQNCYATCSHPMIAQSTADVTGQPPQRTPYPHATREEIRVLRVSIKDHIPRMHLSLHFYLSYTPIMELKVLEELKEYGKCYLNAYARLAYERICLYIDMETS